MPGSKPSTGKLVAVIPCEGCDHECELRVSRAGEGYPYYNCPKPADGGCGRQVFTRDRSSAERLAGKAKNWRSKADREKWTGETGTSPAKQTKAQGDKPGDADPATEKKKSFLDWEL